VNRGDHAAQRVVGTPEDHGPYGRGDCRARNAGDLVVNVGRDQQDRPRRELAERQAAEELLGRDPMVLIHNLVPHDRDHRQSPAEAERPTPRRKSLTSATPAGWRRGRCRSRGERQRSPADAVHDRGQGGQATEDDSSHPPGVQAQHARPTGQGQDGRDAKRTDFSTGWLSQTLANCEA